MRDGYLYEITHAPYTHRSLSFSIPLKKKQQQHRWLLPSVFCTIFVVVVVDVDLHTHFYWWWIYYRSLASTNAAPWVVATYFALVSFQNKNISKVIVVSSVGVTENVVQTKMAPTPYTNKTLNQLHTRLYMPGWLKFDASTRYHSTRKALQQQQRTK